VTTVPCPLCGTETDLFSAHGLDWIDCPQCQRQMARPTPVGEPVERGRSAPRPVSCF
jgi:ribosomal protein S27E